MKKPFTINASDVIDFATQNSLVYACGESKKFSLVTKASPMAKPFVVENLVTGERHHFFDVSDAVKFFNDLRATETKAG